MKQTLDILMNLPYETITIFDGNKTKQITIVKYSEVIKQINLLRNEELKENIKQNLIKKLAPKS